MTPETIKPKSGKAKIGYCPQFYTILQFYPKLDSRLFRVERMMAMQDSASWVVGHGYTPAAALSTRTHSYTSPMSMS